MAVTSVDVIHRPRPFAWLREHPWVTDVVLAVGATACAVAFHLWAPDSENFNPRDPTWWTVVLTVAASLPIVLRRHVPLITGWITVIGLGVIESMAIYSGVFIPWLIAVYSMGAYSDGRRRTWNALGIGAVVGVSFVMDIWVELFEGYDPDIGLAEVVWTFGVMTAAFLIGDNMRRRRQHMGDLAERAERAERERDLIARERVAEERARIARELHDIVAHSVSGIIIHAQAARRALDDDPVTTRELLGSIEHTGRQAMDELRRVLGVLRENDDECELTPQPSLADLDELIAAYEDLPIGMTVAGELDSLPPGVGLSVYRILQEALTNIRRHAGKVRNIDITMAVDGDGFLLTVDDDGRGPASVTRTEAPGYGIIGMNERVAASRGVLHAGPRPGGGWRVRARFPHGAA